MALRLKAGMELQVVVTQGAGGMGFDLVTRTRVVLQGQAHERETSRTHAHDEAGVWVKLTELAQDRLVGLATEAG